MIKLKYLLIILIILLLGAAGAFWYYFMMSGAGNIDNDPNPSPSSGGFVPLPRTSGNQIVPETETPTTSTSTESTPVVEAVILPTLRQISATPVGGYGASSTAATTLIRWVDRGRGSMYELSLDGSTVTTLSNTIVPRIVESSWNRQANAFIGTLINDSGTSNVVYAELQKETATGSAPFALRGKNFPGNVITYATSPKKDRLFVILNENGTGVGYTAAFNGGTLTRILSTPLTQVVAEWPEDNTITITTKASAAQDGFLYFVNPKTGIMKKVLGPLRGLTTLTSHDAKYVFFSYAGGQRGIQSSIYTVDKSSVADAGFITLSEKCAWGNFYKDVLYCGVPSKFETAIYPDDWHLGTASFNDKIWQASAKTGEIKLLSNLPDQAKTLVDAVTLGLDAKDDFLFFMNKNNLSLWSLDLVSSQ